MCLTCAPSNPGMAYAGHRMLLKKRKKRYSNLPSINYSVLIITSEKMWDHASHSIPSLHLRLPFSVFFPVVASVDVDVSGISFV